MAVGCCGLLFFAFNIDDKKSTILAGRRSSFLHIITTPARVPIPVYVYARVCMCAGVHMCAHPLINFQFSICNLHFRICSFEFAVCIFEFAVCNLPKRLFHLHFSICILSFATNKKPAEDLPQLAHFCICIFQFALDSIVSDFTITPFAIR